MDGSGLNDEQDHGHFSLMWQGMVIKICRSEIRFAISMMEASYFHSQNLSIVI